MPVVLNSGLSVKAKPQNMCHSNAIKKKIKNVLQKGPETEKKRFSGIEPTAEVVDHCLSTWF